MEKEYLWDSGKGSGVFVHTGKKSGQWSNIKASRVLGSAQGVFPTSRRTPRDFSHVILIWETGKLPSCVYGGGMGESYRY